jgi:hypothetical protein
MDEVNLDVDHQTQQYSYSIMPLLPSWHWSATKKATKKATTH